MSEWCDQASTPTINKHLTHYCRLCILLEIVYIAAVPFLPTLPSGFLGNVVREYFIAKQMAVISL